MSLDNIVTLNITRDAPAVSRQGFGTALILGPNATGWSGDRIRTYTKPDGMLTDGFDTGDAEYKAAVKLYSQAVKPVRFKVGLRTANAAQVTTLTPTAVNSTVYTIKVDGVAYTFTSDASATPSEIVAGLLALINADAAALVTASGTTTLILTADTAGVPFTVEVTAGDIAVVATTPNSGISSDLATINAIDSDWYSLISNARSQAEILTAAAWTEAQRKIYLVSTNDAAVIAAGSTDIASKLKAKLYFRTLFEYSADTANYPEAAAAGNFLPLTVGSWTLKFKPQVGITPDALTDSQETIALGKNSNIYKVVAGQPIISEGKVAAGEFLDNIVGIDWIYANIQSDVYQAFLDNNKIPYTDKGVAIIETIVTTRLNLAVAQGILTNDPAPVVTVAKVADAAPEDKSGRRFTGITFQAYLAGAIHAVTINGNVSV